MPRRRTTDKLLTFDRALLVGAFSMGLWAASADIRQENLNARVVQLEERETAAKSADAKHDQELAVIHTELRHINENMTKLADAVVRAFNRIPDTR